MIFINFRGFDFWTFGFIILKIELCFSFQKLLGHKLYTFQVTVECMWSNEKYKAFTVAQESAPTKEIQFKKGVCNLKLNLDITNQGFMLTCSNLDSSIVLNCFSNSFLRISESRNRTWIKVFTALETVDSRMFYLFKTGFWVAD